MLGTTCLPGHAPSFPDPPANAALCGARELDPPPPPCTPPPPPHTHTHTPHTHTPPPPHTHTQPWVLPDHAVFPLEPGAPDLERPAGILAVRVLGAEHVSPQSTPEIAWEPAGRRLAVSTRRADLSHLQTVLYCTAMMLHPPTGSCGAPPPAAANHAVAVPACSITSLRPPSGMAAGAAPWAAVGRPPAHARALPAGCPAAADGGGARRRRH